jgi:hypothetical protein
MNEVLTFLPPAKDEIIFPQKNNLFAGLKTVKSGAIILRNLYSIFKNATELSILNRKSFDFLFSSKLKNLIKVSNLLNIIDFFNDFSKLVKLLEKIAKVEKRTISNALKVLQPTCSLYAQIDDVRRGLEVFITASQVSAWMENFRLNLGFVGISATTLLDLKQTQKSIKYLNNFIKKVDFKKDEGYNIIVYKNLCNFFDMASAKELNKQFNTNGEIFSHIMKKKLDTLEIFENKLNENQKNELEKIITLLIDRLKYQSNNNYLNLTNDLLGLLSYMAALMNPAFLFSSGVYFLVVRITRYVEKLIEDYDFEKGLGMMDREFANSSFSSKNQALLSEKKLDQFKDFSLWYCVYYQNINIQ